MFLKEFDIEGRFIGEKHPPYIIAEMSANHGGKIERAFKIIKLAKLCGADAIKIQVYNPDALTINSKKKDFIINNHFKWKNKSLYDLYDNAKTPIDWVQKLMDYAKKTDITLFASVFDISTIKKLEKLGMPAYKIASFEANYHELIIECLKTKKPIIISTGLCSKNEIIEIVNLLKKKLAKKVILLKCVSSYPTLLSESNLSLIPRMKKDFKMNIGLSDHTLGIEAAKAASIIGATVIEKHFIDNKKNKTPDSFFSINPKELKKLVDETKKLFSLRGNSKYGPNVHEKKSLIFRRSIYVIKNINQGDKFSRDNIAIIRPGKGIQPKFIDSIIGKKTKMFLSKGTALKWEYIK